jgi:glycine/D-amino acid oxidase-like deaminating enzyme
MTDQDNLGQFYNEMVISDVILREARKIINLEDWRIAQNRAGFYCQHKDEIFVNQVSPGIHIVTGIGGKGMTTAAGFAKENISKIRF